MLKFPIRRFGHTLVVPYYHSALTAFKNGIPAEQVRALNQFETKDWHTWTSSPAFYLTSPKTRGVVSVPVGESWIIERFGKYSRTITGLSYVIPFIESVKAVKLQTLCSLGVMAQGEKDTYAVLLYKVTNPEKSLYFLDSETNKRDSEQGAAHILRRALLEMDMKDPNIETIMLNHLKEKEAEFGLEFHSLQLRGIFEKEENVPTRILAYEAPYPDLEGPGHDLAADYWSEVLTPPFFQKCTYGTNKQVVTPQTPSLEWNIPSPPDFHHFNQQPKLAVGPEEDELKKLESH